MPSHIPTVIDPRDGKHYASDEQRATIAKTLRSMADFIEKTELPLPNSALWGLRGRLSIHASTFREADREIMMRPAHVAKAMGGKVEKGILYQHNPQSDFTLTRALEGTGTVQFVFDRASVCTPKEVTKEVTKTQRDPERVSAIDKAIEALEEQRNELPFVTTTAVETVTEYECPPSLLEMDKAAREAAEKAKAEQDAAVGF